jgi:hypothetical protein
MTDYTQLPIGAVLDNGVIEICPHCKLVGLATENNGVKFYCHKILTVLDGDKIITKLDSCPTELPEDVKAQTESHR